MSPVGTSRHFCAMRNLVAIGAKRSLVIPQQSSALYGGGKWYDRGVFRGKRAMCALTIGGPPSMYSEAGLNGSISSILFPINHGMLYFTGFAVIEPFLVHAPARMSQEARVAELARYRARILGLASAPTISYPVLDDYDANYVLRTKSP